jgi:hypothetical protein
MSGGVHCQVIAKCSRTGQTQTFQIGGPAGATEWQKLWYGLIPPKADPNAIPADLPAANQTDYATTCSADDCDCKALQCLQKAFRDTNPPRYYALWQNSNSFAHSLLNQCGCGINPFPWFHTTKDGPMYTTTPRGAVGW